MIITEDGFYFSTYKDDSMFSCTLNIYKSDFKGENIELIYSKGGYYTVPWTYEAGDKFYIEHNTKTALVAESKVIDEFSITTGEYKTVAKGKEADILDYIKKEKESSKYIVEISKKTPVEKHDKFIITDTETGAQKTIDDEYLKNTSYIESMEKFGYGLIRADISAGHILLSYWIGAGDGWSSPHLVFEYIFESDTLEYKMLAFPDEAMYVDIVYIDNQ